jgi:hypothetical protein
VPYPRWRYFPAYAAPPDWVDPLVSIFAAARANIDSAVEHAKPMQSDDVLKELEPGLIGLGFVVEQGKTKTAKLPRPVFFGDEGKFLRTYEIDTFEPTRGIAMEVEAGRATMGNAIYRDLIQSSLMVDARFLVLAVPVEYRYKSKGKQDEGAEPRKDVLRCRGDLRQPSALAAVRGAAARRLLSARRHPG